MTTSSTDMLKVSIDYSDLLRWIGYAMQSRGRIDVAISEALNEAGDALTNELAKDLALDFEVPVGSVQGLIQTSRSSPQHPQYVIDTRMALDLSSSGRQIGGRSWSRRPEEFFREGELVKIVTAGDQLVCERCQDLQGTIHTIEEARVLLPVHPNCRCSTLSARMRRLPVKYTTRMGRSTRVHTESIALATLASKLRDIPKIALKVT